MRPTGQLHLGNYHGALANWVELQYRYECFFFVADWHALTTGLRGHGRLPVQHERGPDRLAGGRPESERLHDLRAVADSGARGAAPDPFDGHADLVARARADLQGPDRAAQGQGPQHVRLPGLPVAAKRGHPDVPARVRAGRRGPGRPRRDHARDRAPLQQYLWPRAGFRGARSRAPSSGSAPATRLQYGELRRKFQEHGRCRVAREGARR